MKSPATKPQPQQTEPMGPAVVTRMHRQNREIFDDNANVIIGKKGFRRIDRLQWLKDHKSIEEHHLQAGRRFQGDWEMSKLENYSSMQMGRSAGKASADPADAKLDAIDRHNRAIREVPIELRSFLILFLCPEDEPFSLERCAAITSIHRKAAGLAIRLSLSVLARHYGFST